MREVIDKRWDHSDYSLKQEIFDDLATEYGPFDLDASAHEYNTKCPKFIGKEDNVLTVNFKHLNTYLNMWYDLSGKHQMEVLSRWLQHRQEAPQDTHICIVVPHWTSTKHQPWYKLLREHFTVVRTYPPGAKVFNSPDYRVDGKDRPYRDAGPTKWETRVYVNKSRHTTRLKPVSPAMAELPQIAKDNLPITKTLNRVSEENPTMCKLHAYYTHKRAKGNGMKMLIDSGASHSFITSNTVKRLGVPTVSYTKPQPIELGDGTVIHIKEKVIAMPILINGINGTYAGHNNVDVIPTLDDKDTNVVLGLDWLRQMGATLNFQDNTLHLKHYRGGKLTISCADDTPTEFMGYKQFMKLQRRLPKHEQRIFKIIVKQQTDEKGQPITKDGFLDPDAVYFDEKVPPEIQQKFRNLLAKFAKSVFPEECPDGLPPHRPEVGDCTIPTKQDAKPPSKQPYRLSTRELEELRTQLDFPASLETP